MCKSSFYLPGIVIIKIKCMWDFLIELSISIEYLIETHTLKSFDWEISKIVEVKIMKQLIGHPGYARLKH